MVFLKKCHSQISLKVENMEQDNVCKSMSQEVEMETHFLKWKTGSSTFPPGTNRIQKQTHD